MSFSSSNSIFLIWTRVIRRKPFWMRGADKTDDLKQVSYANPFNRVQEHKPLQDNTHKLIWTIITWPAEKVALCLINATAMIYIITTWMFYIVCFWYVTITFRFILFKQVFFIYFVFQNCAIMFAKYIQLLLYY